MTPRRGSLLIIIALVFSAAAFYFGTGLHPVWWLMWLAPIPVLLVAPRLSGKWAFAVASLAWIAGAMNEWRFFRGALEVPLTIVVVFTVLPAVIFALTVLAYRRFVQAGALWRAALVFPSIWVLAEFINARTSIHGTAANISYTQMNFLPALQIASITGIWGISFCLFLFASTVSIVLGGYGEASQRRRVALGFFALLLVVLGFGVWRLKSTPAAQGEVKVGLVASDLRQNLINEERPGTMRMLNGYLEQVQALAAQGAKVVVIPEKVAVITPSDLPEVDRLLQSTADATGTKIIIGFVDVTSEAHWNEARIYTPSGPIRTYEKHHMLPPFESKLEPGTTLTEWDEPSGRWGVAICKDMDFPQTGRDYGNNGIGLLLVPAWDFSADGWLHGRMAILRGVEGGFSIARSPKQGVLTITDDRGRVIAEKDSSSAPFATLIAAVPVRHEPTIYACFGDWFGWANVAVFAALMGSVLQSRTSARKR
jgi:apolipoprotein N-acyltransferase